MRWSRFLAVSEEGCLTRNEMPNKWGWIRGAKRKLAWAPITEHRRLMRLDYPFWEEKTQWHQHTASLLHNTQRHQGHSPSQMLWMSTYMQAQRWKEKDEASGTRILSEDICSIHTDSLHSKLNSPLRMQIQRYQAQRLIHCLHILNTTNVSLLTEAAYANLQLANHQPRRQPPRTVPSDEWCNTIVIKLHLKTKFQFHLASQNTQKNPTSPNTLLVLAFISVCVIKHTKSMTNDFRSVFFNSCKV